MVKREENVIETDENFTIFANSPLITCEERCRTLTDCCKVNGKQNSASIAQNDFRFSRLHFVMGDGFYSCIK